MSDVYKIEEIRNKILHGNVMSELKKIPDKSIDCIVTSPPYWGLRDYGEDTNTVWDGDCNCKHEWNITIVHHDNLRFRRGKSTDVGNCLNQDIYSNPDVKNAFCKKCGAWYGQLGLEPTLDLYIEHMLQITSELKRVLKKTGVMFWNHGDSYGGGGNPNDRKLANGLKIPQFKDVSVKPKCMAMQNYRLILRMIDEQGWLLRNILIWHKPNHMPSSVKDRFTNAYEPVFMLVRNKKYWFDLDSIRIPCKTLKINSNHTLGKNPSDVWSIPTQPFPEAHFAVYPEKLIIPMIKSGCPKNGIVLDPFMGSGTTALVSKKLGRDFVGIELNKKYIEMANRRINEACLQICLF